MIFVFFALCAEAHANPPSSYEELREQVFKEWSELSLESLETLLLSQSNAHTQTFVDAFSEGASPADLDMHLNTLLGKEETNKKILAQLILKLREQPQKALSFLQKLEQLEAYVEHQEIRTQIGLSSFTSLILAIDFTAIFYSMLGNGGDFVTSFMHHPIFLQYKGVILALIGWGVLSEALSFKDSVQALVEHWSKKRRKRAFIKQAVLKIKDHIHENTLADPAPSSNYLNSQEIEEDAFSLARELIETSYYEILRDLLESPKAGDSHLALQKFQLIQQFTRKLKKNFSPLELLYLTKDPSLAPSEKDFKALQAKLSVLMSDLYLKIQNLPPDYNSRHLFENLSFYKDALNQNRRPNKILSGIGIGLITVASAMISLELAVTSVGVDLVQGSPFLSQISEFIHRHQHYIFVLSASALPLSLDLTGMLNRTSSRIKRRNRLVEARTQIRHLESLIRIQNRPWLLLNPDQKVLFCKSIL